MLEMAQLNAAAPSGQLRTIPQIEASITIHKEDVVRGFLGIGRDLLDAKAQLNQHGQWMPWVERMGFNQSTANKYMRLAKEVQPGSALEGLSFNKTLALVSLPEGEREDFARAIDAEHKSAAEIRRLIKERDQLRVDAAELRKEAETLRNTPPKTVTVYEVPDDYQELKRAVEDLRTQVVEAEDAAVAAEAARNEAQRQLRALQATGEAPKDRYTKITEAANAFLILANVLAYDRTEMGTEQQRQRYWPIVKEMRRWVLDMQRALEIGPLNAEGVVS